ncbi:MAG: Terpene synthase, metal-binding protein [Myxococcales bacterium]|nr:Terpene synthase, metal-binding protein [Myxococcales bacterium]
MSVGTLHGRKGNQVVALQDPASFLYCPFDARISPHSDLIQARSIVWARRFGVCSTEGAFQKLAAAGIARLVARGFPGGSPEGLQIAADWTTLFCLLDDRTEAAGLNMIRLAELLSEMTHAYRGVTPRGGDSFSRAMKDLGQRMRATAGDAWGERFGLILESLFSAFLWENVNRSNGIRPSLSAYVTMREQTVGLHPQFALAEITDGIKLSDEEAARPDVQRLAAMTSRLIGWVNDIFTVDKEQAEGEVHNLVLVMVEECGMSQAEARHAAVQQHNVELRAFVELEQTVRASVEPASELVRYLDMLRAWNRGHLDWARETSRYRAEVAAQRRVGHA